MREGEPLPLPGFLKRFFELWKGAGLADAYLVGGYVRNLLLGLAEGDLDIASPELPQKVARKLQCEEVCVEERAYGLGTVVIQQRFGERLYVYEYTAFRCDNYGRGGAHTPVSVAFTQDMDLDAQRRDFTINALYMGADGRVADPTGRGLAAIGNRLVEQVTEETLAQDALRILRMVRFAAELGFEIDGQTYACAKRYAPQLQDISAERIRDEFFKILLADQKYGNTDGVLCGLHLLKDLGALRFIVPRLEDGDGLAQNPNYHAHDVLEHSLRACACAPPDLEVRLAALLHDIAKPEAWHETGKMYGHDKLGAVLAEQALSALRVDKETTRHVCALVRAHMFDLNNDAGKRAVIRMIAKLGQEQFLKLCAVREADFCGSGMGNPPLSAEKWRGILEELVSRDAPLNLRQLAVNGDDLMRELDLPAGKRIGELLQALHAYALKKPSQNNYKSLIKYAKIINTCEYKPEKN